MESDLVKTRYADFDELRQYCYQVASVVGLICIHIFGYRGGEIARQHATDLGLAMQLTNICRDVREDWEFGRVYLPQDEMRAFGVTEEDIDAGNVTDGFADLLQFQIARAREYFGNGRHLLSYLPRRVPGLPCGAGLYIRRRSEQDRESRIQRLRRAHRGQQKYQSRVDGKGLAHWSMAEVTSVDRSPGIGAATQRRSAIVFGGGLAGIGASAKLARAGLERNAVGGAVVVGRPRVFL